jgi:sterol desaturase/sphingolipid hydroxylase (fatty acid hydroxylase superfamily)
MFDLTKFFSSPPAAHHGATAMLSFTALTLAFIAAELLYAKLSHHDEDHDIAETGASIGVAVGDIVARIVTGGMAAMPFLWLYSHRLFDINLRSVWALAALFIGVEFSYYWFHRAAHSIRWLWATHAVHHSATHFNLSAAIRLGWTGQLTGAFVFFLPLAWLGFNPLAIATMLSLGLLYQFFLHTSLNINLGPLEWLLNSPIHHRVHHASNDTCLDRNYGSILIVFDRLFGTFATAPREEKLRFGLKGRALGNNPFHIALGEWLFLIKDARAANGFFAKLKVLFGRP